MSWENVSSFIFLASSHLPPYLLQEFWGHVISSQREGHDTVPMPLVLCSCSMGFRKKQARGSFSPSLSFHPPFVETQDGKRGEQQPAGVVGGRNRIIVVEYLWRDQLPSKQNLGKRGRIESVFLGSGKAGFQGCVRVCVCRGRLCPHGCSTARPKGCK